MSVPAPRRSKRLIPTWPVKHDVVARAARQRKLDEGAVVRLMEAHGTTTALQEATFRAFSLVLDVPVTDLVQMPRMSRRIGYTPKKSTSSQPPEGDRHTK
jgi:hypothetical protein